MKKINNKPYIIRGTGRRGDIEALDGRGGEKKGGKLAQKAN